MLGISSFYSWIKRLFKNRKYGGLAQAAVGTMPGGDMLVGFYQAEEQQELEERVQEIEKQNEKQDGTICEMRELVVGISDRFQKVEKTDRPIDDTGIAELLYQINEQYLRTHERLVQQHANKEIEEAITRKDREKSQEESERIQSQQLMEHLRRIFSPDEEAYFSQELMPVIEETARYNQELSRKERRYHAGIQTPRALKEEIIRTQKNIKNNEKLRDDYETAIKKDNRTYSSLEKELDERQIRISVAETSSYVRATTEYTFTLEYLKQVKLAKAMANSDVREYMPVLISYKEKVLERLSQMDGTAEESESELSERTSLRRELISLKLYSKLLEIQNRKYKKIIAADQGP